MNTDLWVKTRFTILGVNNSFGLLESHVGARKAIVRDVFKFGQVGDVVELTERDFIWEASTPLFSRWWEYYTEKPRLVIIPEGNGHVRVVSVGQAYPDPRSAIPPVTLKTFCLGNHPKYPSSEAALEAAQAFIAATPSDQRTPPIDTALELF